MSSIHRPVSARLIHATAWMVAALAVIPQGRGQEGVPLLERIRTALSGLRERPAGNESASNLPVLTSIAEVVGPGRSGAPVAAHPVRIEGVVTHTKGWLGPWLTIHDGQNGCAVRADGIILPVKTGQRVEVTGELAADVHFSYVTRARVRLRGEAPLPPPRPASGPDLDAAHLHAGFVRLTASVLDVCRTDGKLIYLLGSGGTGFNAFVEEPAERLPLDHLNATIEVQGVPWGIVSGQGTRPSRSNLYVTGHSWIKVLSPGAPNRWGRPRSTLKQLAEAPPSDTRHVLSGVVTYSSPTGVLTIDDGTEQGYVSYLDPIPRDNKKAEFVPRGPRPAVKPGDRIEVVCTKRRQRAHSPWLEWSEVQVTGHDELPEPAFITEDELLSGEADCRRVQLRGRVVDYEYTTYGPYHTSRLLLNTGRRVGYVTLTGDARAPFDALPGSQVEITGVPVVTQGNVQAVRGYTVYLSNPADLRILPPPPPWRNPSTLKIAGGVLGVLLLTGGWIFALRRRVAVRTAELRTSNERLLRSEHELQRALSQEQEISRMKSNFVSVVSHEFRTPLGVIVSSADILRRYFDRLNAGDRSDQLNAILRSSRTLGHLIEDLLLLGKVEAGKLTCQPGPMDAATLCRHLTDEILSATHRSSPVNLTLSPNLEGAMGDEALLRPALTNLLSNAVKYSEPGSPVDFLVSREGTDARFVIRDRGIGIPNTDQKQLFDVFARGSNVGTRPGTGLGLVIARRCVELHGGSIAFESIPGEGTAFTVTIPLWEAPPPPPAAAPVS